jgi:hypothetical protein
MMGFDPFKPNVQIDEEIEIFQQQAVPLVATGKKGMLKRLFAQMSAKLRMADEKRAQAKMRKALRDAILDSQKKLRRGLFDDF